MMDLNWDSNWKHIFIFSTKVENIKPHLSLNVVESVLLFSCRTGYLSSFATWLRERQSWNVDFCFYETKSSHHTSLRNLVEVENCVHWKISWGTFHWIVSKSVKLCSDEIHCPNNFLTALTLIELEFFLSKNILWHRNEEKGEKTIFLLSQRERKKKSGCWV